MFFTKKKVVSALVLGGAGATAAVIYALKGGVVEEAPISIKRSQGEIEEAAKKIVDEIGELDSGGVF